MTARITVTECPNCGAPVDPQAIGDPDKPACPFCHTILPVAEDPPPPPTFTFGPMSTGPAATASAASVRKTRRLVTWLVLIPVLLIVGLSVGIPLIVHHSTSLGSTSGPSSYIVQTAVPTLTGPAGMDAYVIANDPSVSDTAVLRRVDLRHSRIVWSSNGIAVASGDQPTVVAAGSRVIVIADTSVYAFDASTGKRLWQSSVAYNLATRPSDEALAGQVNDCVNGCATVIGGTLVTLAKDGTVQGLAVASGQQLWSRRLSDTPDFLQPAGSWAAIVSSPNSGRDDLLLFNPLNGSERTVAPACAADSEGDLAYPSDDSAWFIGPTGGAVTVLITGSGGCVASYRIPDGELLSRSAPDAENAQIPFTLTGESAAAGAGYVAWTNEVGSDRSIFVANETSGAIRPLIDTGSENGTTNLDGMVGNTLVAEVAPEYASDEPGIYGVSMSTGKQQWMLPSRVTSESNFGSQSVVVTRTGIAVVACHSSADDSTGTCRFEAVDPPTGDIAGTLNVNALDPAPTADAAIEPSGLVLANVDEQLAISFDPRNGNTGSWPTY